MFTRRTNSRQRRECGSGNGLAPVGAFTPASITSATKRSWHAGDDNSTIVPGTGVALWTDKFLNGYDVAQGTGSKQPTISAISGRQALLFASASSQFLILTDAARAGVFGGDDTPFTAYFVLQATGSAGLQVVWSFAASVTNTIYHLIYKNGTVPVSQRQAADVATTASFTGAIANATPYLLRARFDGTNMVYILNGTTLTTGTPNANAALASVDQFVFGAYKGSGAGSLFLNGAIGEAATYTEVVDTAEETRLVNEYFVPRWPGVA